MKKSITVYQALEERKKLEDRISRLEDNTYSIVGIRVKGKDHDNQGTPIEDLEKMIQSGYDKGAALLHNYIAVKAAINESNAKTVVTVGGKEYIIANALVRQRLLAKEKRYWQRMLADYESACREVDNNNKNVQKKADEHVETMFKDNKTKSAETIREVTNSFLDGKVYELFDPMNIKDAAEKKLEELEQFETDLHFALTQSNCETMVEIDYAD